MHGLICLNEITSPQLKMLVAPRRSAHQMGQQQLLLEPFIGILESLEEAAILFKRAMRLHPIILNGIALPVGFEFFGSGKIR